MLSLSLAWHIVWFTRVTLSLALFLIVIRRQPDKEFRLFAVYTGWIAVAGTAMIAINYAPFVSGYQYFAAMAVTNGIETALAFAIIYQMFAQRVRRYPQVSGVGRSAFRATTLIFVVIAVALAWFSPGREAGQWTWAYSVIQRTMRTLQCGQLVFLFLFCGYLRLSWRSRAFGIALGLGIHSGSALAINAIHSQIASAVWTRNWYLLALANDSTYLVAVLVWLSYILAPERTPQSMGGAWPEHDLETWNQELERLLEP